jgi:hypothetical protein
MMRVLFCDPPGGAFTFITQGMINALRDAGCVAERWDGKISSWDNFAPDLYCGASGHRQNLPNTRQCQVALHVNPHGPTKIEPNINESIDSIEWVVNMRPDVVFGYGHESDRHLWSYWHKHHGIMWVPMATAGDATAFFRRNEHPKYDIGYVGGRWPYKAKNIDTFLLPVLRDKTISRKVCGWGTWPNGLCSGHIEDHEVPTLLSSCKVAPCISEPHTLVTGIDLPERVFKAALSGAVVVHDPALGVDRYIPSIIVGNNPEDFHTKISELVRMDADDLRCIADKQFREVLAAHTYHHRMATLMKALFQNNAADQLLLAVQKFKL